MNEYVIFIIAIIGIILVVGGIFIVAYLISRSNDDNETSTQPLLVNMENLPVNNNNNNKMSNHNPMNFGALINLESEPSTQININTQDLLTSPITTPLPDSDILEPLIMNDGKVMEIQKYEGLDILSYGQKLYLLKKNHTIVDEEDKVLKSNVQLDHIFVFAGYVYGIGSGELYEITNDIDEDWIMKKVENVHIKNITRYSTSLDEDVLFLQNNTEGVLYDSEFNTEEKININDKYRIYGKDRNTFKDMESVKFKNACMDYYGQIHTSNIYLFMKIINWDPVALK